MPDQTLGIFFPVKLLFAMLKKSSDRELNPERRGDLMSTAFFEPVETYATLILPQPLLDLTINGDSQNDTAGKENITGARLIGGWII